MRFKIANSKFKIYILNLKFLLLGVFLLALPVRAQGLALGIWPPLLEVTIQPGKAITQVYKLVNEGETDLLLTSRVVPFKPLGEQGETEIWETQGEAKNTEEMSEDKLALEAVDWFSFQNANLALGEKFLLPAGATQEIVLKIKVPADAREDDYYLTLLFETIPEAFLPAGSGGQIEAKIGSNILLTVSQTGEPLKKAVIKTFSIRNPQLVIGKLVLIDSFSQPQFLLRLANTGRAFFKPQGAITTSGWLGQKWVLNLLPENVLANSVRQITCQGGEEASGWFPTPCRLPAKFLLGKYTAKVELGLDEAGGKYQSELVFWALPIKLFLGILTIFLLLYILKSKLKI